MFFHCLQSLHTAQSINRQLHQRVPVLSMFLNASDGKSGIPNIDDQGAHTNPPRSKFQDKNTAEAYQMLAPIPRSPDFL
jgi:hypothetical protein